MSSRSHEQREEAISEVLTDISVDEDSTSFDIDFELRPSNNNEHCAGLNISLKSMATLACLDSNCVVYLFGMKL